MTPQEQHIQDRILQLVADRGPGRSVCPSEVARRIRPDDWRPLMPDVRRVAGQLADEGKIRVTQRGSAVDPETARGPIRLTLPDSNTDQ